MISIDKLNEVISQYPNTKFAMIYIEDFTEAIIAPDNSVYFLNGENSVIEDVDYYSLFNKEINLCTFFNDNKCNWIYFCKDST